MKPPVLTKYVFLRYFKLQSSHCIHKHFVQYHRQDFDFCTSLDAVGDIGRSARTELNKVLWAELLSAVCVPTKGEPEVRANNTSPTRLEFP